MSARCMLAVGLLAFAIFPAATTLAAEIDPQTQKLIAELRTKGKAQLAAHLQRDYERAVLEIERFSTRTPDNGAHIVVGRIVLSDRKDKGAIWGQMIVWEDGYFVGAVREAGVPVQFRKHNYEPIDLITKGGDRVAVEHVGAIRMKRLKPGDAAKLTGKIILEEYGEKPRMSDVILHLSVDGRANTPQGGIAGGRAWPEPISPRIKATGEFTASGFSPHEYTLSVSAPGRVRQFHTVTFAKGQTLTFPDIVLEAKRSADLEFVVSPDGKFDGGMVKTQQVVGGEHWRSDDAVASYGHDLIFDQRSGQLVMESRYGPCRLAVLGKGELSAFLSIDATAQKFRSPNGLVVEDGHVYLLDQGHWKHWVLFRATVPVKPAAN